MASVWYVGGASVRTMLPADWDEAGADAAAPVVWDQYNGWSVPEDVLSAPQISWLEQFPDEFITNAPNGPRQSALIPAERFVTLRELRILLDHFVFPEGLGPTPAMIGLDQVDNTSDEDKPVSAATRDALSHKADYPDGGTDGQVLVKSGTSTAWANGGSGDGSIEVAPVTDSRLPSGTAYTFSGSGLSTVTDNRLPSGTAYKIGS